MVGPRVRCAPNATVDVCRAKLHADRRNRKEAPPLPPDESTTYNFVIRTDKPFTKTKVNVSRLILEGGKVIDPRKNVVIQE
jgi:hypothetical protein